MYDDDCGLCCIWHGIWASPRTIAVSPEVLKTSGPARAPSQSCRRRSHGSASGEGLPGTSRAGRPDGRAAEVQLGVPESRVQVRSASGRTEAAGARARPWRLASHCPKACRRALAPVARHPAARERQLRRPSPLARFCDAVRPHKSQSPVAAAKVLCSSLACPRLSRCTMVAGQKRPHL